MKTIFISFFTLTTAFAMGSWGPKFPSRKTPVPPPTEVETPEKKVEGRTSVVIVSLTGFSEAQAERFKKIAANTEKVINSPKFKTMVLDWFHKGKRQFFDTPDSNPVVFENVMKSDWNLEYRLEWLFRSSTIGYTYADVTWIALNSRRYGGMTDAEVSANICHEAGGA